jgi:hypothetical protein
MVGNTHLHGKFIGKLLIVVGFDANNEIFPLCFALVEEETDYIWT